MSSCAGGISTPRIRGSGARRGTCLSFAPLSKAIHCHFEVNLTKAMRCKRWILEGCDDRQMIAFSKPFLTQQVIYNETICEFFETPRTFAMNQGSATTEITLPTNLSPGRPLSVQTFGLTDPGRVRHSNEDQFFIAELAKAMKVLYTSMPQPTTQHSDERGYLFIVADGMGGHRAGEHASALAVETIETFVLNTLKWFFMLKGGDDLNILKEFQTALQQADAKVCQEAAQHSEFAGMGTTVTMAHSIGSRLFVVHVGDSRCYLFRGTKLHRLTHDHTLVEEMVSRATFGRKKQFDITFAM